MGAGSFDTLSSKRRIFQMKMLLSLLTVLFLTLPVFAGDPPQDIYLDVPDRATIAVTVSKLADFNDQTFSALLAQHKIEKCPRPITRISRSVWRCGDGKVIVIAVNATVQEKLAIILGGEIRVSTELSSEAR